MSIGLRKRRHKNVCVFVCVELMQNQKRKEKVIYRTNPLSYTSADVAKTNAFNHFSWLYRQCVWNNKTDQSWVNQYGQIGQH